MLNIVYLYFWNIVSILLLFAIKTDRYGGNFLLNGKISVYIYYNYCQPWWILREIFTAKKRHSFSVSVFFFFLLFLFSWSVFKWMIDSLIFFLYFLFSKFLAISSYKKQFLTPQGAHSRWEKNGSRKGTIGHVPNRLPTEYGQWIRKTFLIWPWLVFFVFFFIYLFTFFFGTVECEVCYEYESSLL